MHPLEVSNDLALAGPELAHLFILAYLEDRIAEAKMTQTTTMTVRISGALSEFVASNVGENGAYENIKRICPRPYSARQGAGRAGDL